MPVTPTYPGLYIEELPSANHSITPAPTSVTVFIGYTHPFQGQCAELGTWGQATRIFSFTDYERLFGGLYRSAIVPSDVADGVYQFFMNGGSDAYVVGLQPQYIAAGGARTAVTGAVGSIAGIQFTSKQLTDASQMVAITIRNIDATRAIADIIISFGNTVERYARVKTIAGAPAGIVDPDYIAKRLASSKLVKIDPAAGGQYAAAYVTTAPTPMTTVTLNLTTMTPGPVISMGDFIGVFANDAPLDKVEIFNLLTIPGITDFGVWSAALSYCERKRAFFIMDPPANASADDTSLALGMTKIEDQDLNGLIPHFSPNGALYFPYLNTVDPISGKTRVEPPSGFVAGIYARTDMRRGVWKAPAGLEASVANTTGVVATGKMTDMRQGTVNDNGINVLRSFPGSGTVVWGARTLGTLEQWRYVPVRRMALFIEQTLLRNLGWVVFEPNDEPLWTAMRISVENFMLSLFRQQAFEGSTPRQAFLVQCDHTTTTQDDIDKGVVNIIVGFRPLKPAEFVIIKITQLAGQVS